MKNRLDQVKARLMLRIAGFIGQQHESAWKRLLARWAQRLNLARYGRQPLSFLDEEESIDLMDYEAEDNPE
ncbi:Uncharacterised protein [Zhongshania aliphaticivorans]|uniref:Uncharacterized protein n=1 Tax=Zhongshania aliphaticivorans TaxID=1470434 RepID=A0A5S9Q1I2_9GAMM|nr:hypothetical protein [Zhongshania aliphaticivorans]CAA0111004.1 Uncharacterised protein [Zhongshania aliphaticivorans]CAA0118400.1 Uncharacterised protein [Zhongshania aliphaticivorans]CAA0122423.1 Uncharacterised protein [Zhongshania aliphaticivorans]